MSKIKQKTILDLALAITKKNIEKGRIYKKPKYVGNKTQKPKTKTKNHAFKTKDGVVFHVRGNMSGKAFKNLIEKNSDDIDKFIESDNQMMKL